MFRIGLILFLGISLFGGELVLGVVPQQSPVKLQAAWAPVADYLSRKTGLNVRFKTEASIAAFERELYAGHYDLAYMNPYHYVLAHRAQGYEARVRASKLLQGIIVVPKEGGVGDVSSLRGKTILFPSPNAFAATLVTKYELKSKFGIDVEKEMQVLYVNSHDSVYKGVARGIGDAGGGIRRTFDSLSDTAAREGLKILYTTRSYPSHPVAVKGSLPPAVQQKLTQAWLEMPAGLTDPLGFNGIVPTHDGEYESVRELAAQFSGETP